MQASEIQVSKPRIHPNGQHGDIVKVGANGVTAIEISDGMAIVSYIRSGGPGRFVVTDFLHGVLVEDREQFVCEKCGTSCKNAQGLGRHMLTHTAEKDVA